MLACQPDTPIDKKIRAFPMSNHHIIDVKNG
ncbi:hypothetical protein BN440_2366 [Erwinia amylovora MR1]|nr:hypothetical protein BN440_2366 [Erwinia amylovora MR1]